jgi:hypothetical protein
MLKKNYSERQTREIWRQADAVAFDVDATVIKDTGINELAVLKGVGEQVRLCSDPLETYVSFCSGILSDSSGDGRQLVVPSFAHRQSRPDPA